MGKMLFVVFLVVGGAVVLMFLVQDPKPVSEVHSAEAASSDSESPSELKKEFEDLRAESESTLLLAQTPPSRRPCLVYTQYTKMTKLKERYVKAPNLFIPKELTETLEELGIRAAEQVYEVVKRGQPFECDGWSSAAIEESARILGEYRSVVVNPDVIRVAYLAAVRPEIKAVLIDYQENHLSDTANFARLLIGHAEDVWGFTREDLGITLRLHRELFPEQP